MDNNMDDNWNYHLAKFVEEMEQMIARYCKVPEIPRDICQHGGSAPHPANTTKQRMPLPPPTTSNAQGDVPPPPPSSCQHSHVPGVVHKHVTQTLQPAHATTPEPLQQRAATPNAKEGTGSAPRHVANGPKGPSVPLTHATATRHKRCPATQHRRRGVEVRRPPPRTRGIRPPLLTPCIQGKPQRCTEKRNVNPVDRPGHDPPTAATPRHHHHAHHQGAPKAPPTATVDQGQPQRRAETRNAEFVGRSGCDPPTTTTHAQRTTTTIGGHLAHPLPSTVHRVQGLRRCAQARGADRPTPNARAPPPTDDHNGARPRQRSDGTTSNPPTHP